VITMCWRTMITVIALLMPCWCLCTQPVPVIFDTDMGNDVDDAVALAILHALETRGEARILAVTITKDHPEAAPYVDLVNTFYGRGGIPIGVVKNGKTPEASNMLHVPLTARAADGTWIYPRRLASGSDAPDAVSVLRKTLAAAEDASVVIIQVGFSTNLARLLDSPADAVSTLNGRELAARKVRLLSAMAGHFPTGKPEYNVHIDIPSARKVFSEWPTPIVASGFEIGESMKMPASSVERDMAWTKHHPVADAYRAYHKMPYDRPTWDPTTALYAVRAEHGYFGLSEPGRIAVHDDGRTTFETAPGGKHRYLTVNELQKARALEAMVLLATQPAK
jgi:inosine-uridine nucleoside N-ribohydrolase